MIDEHLGSLKLFHNAVFHFQRKAKKHQQFLDADKLNWAEKLHFAYVRSLRRKDGSMDEVNGPRAVSPVAKRPRRQFIS